MEGVEEVAQRIGRGERGAPGGGRAPRRPGARRCRRGSRRPRRAAGPGPRSSPPRCSRSAARGRGRARRSPGPAPARAASPGRGAARPGRSARRASATTSTVYGSRPWLIAGPPPGARPPGGAPCRRARFTAVSVVDDGPELLVGREERLHLGHLLQADVPGAGRAPEGDRQLPGRVLRAPLRAGTAGPPAFAAPLVDGAPHQVRQGVQPGQEGVALLFQTGGVARQSWTLCSTRPCLLSSVTCWVGAFFVLASTYRVSSGVSTSGMVETPRLQASSWVW